jgi:hypothetical protein
MYVFHYLHWAPRLASSVLAQLGDGRSSVEDDGCTLSGVTVVAQWAKATGTHCYAAGSIPAVIPRYSTNK